MPVSSATARPSPNVRTARNQRDHRLPNRFGYGWGVALDHAQLGTGSLASGAVGVLSPDGFRVTEFTLPDRLPGWPEYFAGFAFAPDAPSVYGVTSAFRLIPIRTDGEIVASVPVY